MRGISLFYGRLSGKFIVPEVLVSMDLSLLPESLTGMGGVSYDLSCSPHSAGGVASDDLPSWRSGRFWVMVSLRNGKDSVVSTGGVVPCDGGRMLGCTTSPLVRTHTVKTQDLFCPTSCTAGCCFGFVSSCDPHFGSSLRAMLSCTWFFLCSLFYFRNEGPQPAAAVCSSNFMGCATALYLPTSRIFPFLQEVAAETVPLKIAHLGSTLFDSSRFVLIALGSNQGAVGWSIQIIQIFNNCEQVPAKMPDLKFLLKFHLYFVLNNSFILYQ